jgi:predicted nucleic-acid-binding Zn-ribbon protein
MKATGTCPKCAGQSVLRVEVTDQVEGSLLGLTQEAYICESCRYIEFYAHDPQAFRDVARREGSQHSGPFR